MEKMKQYTIEVFEGVSEDEANLILEAFKKTVSNFHISNRYERQVLHITILSHLSAHSLAKWRETTELFLSLHKEGRLTPASSKENNLNINVITAEVYPGLRASCTKPYREEGLDFDEESKAVARERDILTRIEEESWDYEDDYDDYYSYSDWPYDEEDFDDGP